MPERASSSIEVLNETRDTHICVAVLADTSRTRLFGLLGRRGLSLGTGLLIRPSSGVHTWGMRFTIDIMALDAQLRIIGMWRDVGPWKIRGLTLKTRSVLELAPGAIDGSQSSVGDTLRFAVVTPAS